MQNGEANAASVDAAVTEVPSGATAAQGEAAPRQRLIRRTDLAQLLDAKLAEDGDAKDAPRAPDAWLERRLRVFERQMTAMETRQDQVEKNARSAAAAAEEAVKALQATVSELNARADAAEAKAKAVANDLRTALNEAVLRLQTVEGVAHAALAENHAGETPMAVIETEIHEPVMDEPPTPASESPPVPEPPKSYLAEVRKSVAAASAAAEVTTTALEKKAAKVRLGLTRYILGSIVVVTIFAAGAGVAFALPDARGFWVILLMIAAGIVGGMAWAAIPAFLKTRYRVSEVLSTLMLVYVALQVLNYLVSGPWKDPNGHNFPQTPPFTPAQLLPHAIGGTDIPPGLVVAIVLTLVFWVLTTRSVYGFSVRTVGAAPNAARYGGFDASRTVWSTLMISGGMAGLAGILEASSQLGQINLGFPSGYGFTAIIVSFLGRLHPIGVFLAGLILAVTYVGGQVAQTVVHVPSATAGIFQAMMLFFILASDILVRYRLRIIRDAPRPAPAEAVA